MKRYLAVILTFILLGVAPAGTRAAPAGWTCTTEAVEAAGRRLVEAQVLVLPPNSELGEPAAQPFTRSSFAMMLVRAMGRVDEARALQGDPAFSDLRDHWAAPYVTLLAQEGIVTGYLGGAFGPERNITWHEAELMLARMLRLGDGLTLESADEALVKAGVDTNLPACTSSPYAARGPLFQLVDRAMQITMYSRFRVDGAPASGPSPANSSPCDAAEIQAAFTRLFEAKVFTSMPGSPIELSAPVTRAPMATVLVRVMGRGGEALALQGAPAFSDLHAHWAAQYVTLLAQDGIVKGYPSAAFGPEQLISWPDAKLMVARMLRLGGSLTPAAADEALRKAGIETTVPACGGNDDHPSRAQVFVLIDRAMQTSLYARLPH